MKKIIGVLMAMSLLLVACGGSTPVTTDEALEDNAETTETASDVEAESDAGDEPMPEGESTDDAPEAVVEDIEDEGDAISVSSLDDIPQVCRDLMSDFLKDIEPVVGPVDWENATLADFEAVSVEFEARSDQFDIDSAATGECDDIDMADGEDFDILVEFGKQDAPGTVGFLTFISELASGIEESFTPEGGAFETCDDAIAFIDDLISQYDSGADVPVAELTAIGSVATVMFSCTPEQLEYFDTPEVAAFFDSLG